MMVNDFLSQVEKHMILLRKKNHNTINEFKIQMFQARRNIEKNIIKIEFDLRDSEMFTSQNQSLLQIPSIDSKRKIKQDTTISTNHNSQAMQSKRTSYNRQSQFPTSDFIKNFNSRKQNKQNEDPNRRINTDISVIQQLTLKENQDKHRNDQNYHTEFDALKNDESILINTEDVKKKYQKFISPSAGWAVSAETMKDNADKNDHNIIPFCTEFMFGHEEDNQIQRNFQQGKSNHFFQRENDFFGLQQFDQRHFSKNNTIHELQECQENGQSHYQTN